jgi:hypothetical protein
LEQTARRGITLDEYARRNLTTWERWFKSNLKVADDIAKNGISEADMGAMLKSADRVLGNYTTLSPLERDIVRRFLVPFYPFYRHVMKFTLRMPYMHPLKSQVFRLLGQMDKDLGPLLPTYLGSSVFVGQLGGRDAYINLQNFNPLNTIYDFKPLSMLNPALKVFAQGQMGLDEFGDAYEGPDIYVAGNGMKFKRTVNGWVPFEGTSHLPWWKMALGQFGTPMQFFNLQGYKNPTFGTRLASLMGVPITRVNPNYSQQAYEGMLEAMKYGGQP